MTGLGGKGKDPERCNIVEAEADWILQPAFKLPGVLKAAVTSTDHFSVRTLSYCICIHVRYQ
jgi:hypothetical protein